MAGWVETGSLGVIQAPKPEPRIKRYELTDYEWAACWCSFDSEVRIRGYRTGVRTSESGHSGALQQMPQPLGCRNIHRRKPWRVVSGCDALHKASANEEAGSASFEQEADDVIVHISDH